MGAADGDGGSEGAVTEVRIGYIEELVGQTETAVRLANSAALRAINAQHKDDYAEEVMYAHGEAGRAQEQIEPPLRELRRTASTISNSADPRVKLEDYILLASETAYANDNIVDALCDYVEKLVERNKVKWPLQER